MRILFLRLLVSWWIIPLFWFLYVGVGYLVSGKLDEPIKDAKSFTKDFWYGEK